MHAYLDTVTTPAGPLSFAVDEAGALLWTRFVEGQYRCSIAQELAREGYCSAHAAERTAAVHRQLEEYSAGSRRSFDLAFVIKGCDWQQAVWRVLLSIPWGETRSYAAVATLAGQPGAARDVGWANATNRLPLVVPCHRVIGTDGSLKGFAGGVHLKARLLAHEGAMLRTAA